MFRRKGWAHEYDRMTAEEVRAERKRLMISRGFIYEKEAKLEYLSKLPRAEYRLSDYEPGSIVWVETWLAR